MSKKRLTLDQKIEVARKYAQKCANDVNLASRQFKQGYITSSDRLRIGIQAIEAERLLDTLLNQKR